MPVFSLVVLLAPAFTPVAPDCNAPAADPVVSIPLPGRPFHAIATSDGCWIFVSMMPGGTGAGAGVAVLRWEGGTAKLVRTVAGQGKATNGLALTHDGKILIATTPDALVFYDVTRLTGDGVDPLLGSIGSAAESPGYFQAAVTHDDRYLFASEHGRERIAVVDLAQARRAGFRGSGVLGEIPVGFGPVSLVLSPDGRHLFTTTQIAAPAWRWSDQCKPIGGTSSAPNHARGAVVVIDVSRAIRDAEHAVSSVTPGGCDPVRLALSPDGRRAWVTARSDNAVLEFDAGLLLSDSTNAFAGAIPLPAGPVGLAVFDEGRRLAVSNATRFSPGATDAEVLTILDVSTLPGRVLGSLPAAGGPVDVTVMRDGRTLLLTNLAAQSLQIFDLARLPAWSRK